jgi:hypothetical protein
LKYSPEEFENSRRSAAALLYLRHEGQDVREARAGFRKAKEGKDALSFSVLKSMSKPFWRKGCYIYIFIYIQQYGPHPAPATAPRLDAVALGRRSALSINKAYIYIYIYK